MWFRDDELCDASTTRLESGVVGGRGNLGSSTRLQRLGLAPPLGYRELYNPSAPNLHFARCLSPAMILQYEAVTPLLASQAFDGRDLLHILEASGVARDAAGTK